MESTVLCLLALASCVLIRPASSECKLGGRTLSEGERYENCTQKCRCVYGNVNCEPVVCPPTQPPSTPRCVQNNTRVLEGQCCPVSYCERCADGWYGPDCSKKCGRCASDRCDINSGACTPNEPLCLPGFAGDTCTDSLAKCTFENRTLLHGESFQTCEKKCACNFGSVSCVSGCPPSFSPPSDDCANPIYRIPDGQCCAERFCDPCPDGRYGLGCSRVCGQCAAGTCNITTGACTPHKPLCLPGYFGGNCGKSCPEGKYGRKCSWECGKCAGGHTQCSVISGKCLMESPKCLPGWKGNRCRQKCSDGFFGADCPEPCGACASGKCSPQTGVCKSDEPLCKSGYSGNQCKDKCPPGRFGPECVWECGGCATGRTTCDIQTGECPEAELRCTPGHMGPWCKACDAGTWGEECLQNCSENCARGEQECDRRDGTCVGGCLPGFYGNLCEPAEPAMRMSTVVGIGVGIGLLILVLIVVFTMIYLYCNRRRTRRKDSQSRMDSYLTPVALHPTGGTPNGGFSDVYQSSGYEIPVTGRNDSIPVYSAPDPLVRGLVGLHGEEDELIYEMMLPRTNWNVNLAEIDVGNKVMTQGNFGETQLALWNHNADKSLCTQVGLKRFSGSDSDEQKNLINRELEKLRSMDRCISVLAVLGASTDPTTGDSLLILECTERGSLLAYLRQNRFENSDKEKVTEKRLTKLCKDVAYGMEHISSYSITNVDLAADTILLDKYLNAKITGMVHFQEKDLTQNQIRERQRWDAMETMAYGQHTVHSDVWRYGILMWEVFSLGETPYSDTSVRDLRRKLESGCRLSHPAATPTMAYVLMTECWNANPTSRPSFTTVLSRIRDIQKGVPLSHDLVSHTDSGLYWTAE